MFLGARELYRVISQPAYKVFSSFQPKCSLSNSMTVVNRQTQHYIFPKENTHFNKNANRQRVWQTNAIQVSSKLRWLHLKPHNSSTSVWNLRHCMCLHTVPGRAPQETHWVILLSEMKATGVLTNEQTLHINFKASLELPVN